MSDSILLRHHINLCYSVQQYTDKDLTEFNLDLIFFYNTRFLYNF